MIRVETARVGEDPHDRTSESLRLSSEAGLRLIERHSERADSDDRDGARLIATHTALKASASSTQLRRIELIRRDRATRDEIRDSTAACEQRATFPGREQARGEPGRVQRRPESIARPREVAAGSG